MKTIAITVSGKVQGVNYRASTLQKANELGLFGTVQNKPDGSVYIEVTGQSDELDALVEWCEIGPPAAAVERVEVNDIKLVEFENFRILREE